MEIKLAESLTDEYGWVQLGKGETLLGYIMKTDVTRLVGSQEYGTFFKNMKQKVLKMLIM